MYGKINWGKILKGKKMRNPNPYGGDGKLCVRGMKELLRGTRSKRERERHEPPFFFAREILPLKRSLSEPIFANKLVNLCVVCCYYFVVFLCIFIFAIIYCHYCFFEKKIVFFLLLHGFFLTFFGQFY